MRDHRPPSHRRRKERFRGESGISIIMTALVLVPLMVFAAFGVDLAGFYSRVSELQRAADAAALAGTVWMPDFDRAKLEAARSLEKNGFVDGRDGIVVTYAPGKRLNSFEVTIEDTSVTTYFSSVIGHRQAIARSAEAQYNLPLPLGSPLNYFGGDRTKTVPSQVLEWSVVWPFSHPDSSWIPINSGGNGCNVGENSNQGLGRWQGASHSSGHRGSTRCQWEPRTYTVSEPGNYGTQIRPSNRPCNVFHSSGANGRWTSSSFESNRRHTSGNGNKQCEWVVTDPTTHPSDALTTRPSNTQCNLPPLGSWSSGSSASFRPGSYYESAGICAWPATLASEDVTPPNPMDVDRPSGSLLPGGGSRSPMFWGQIHGPGADQQSGDAYSTRCKTSTNCNNPNNELYIDPGDPEHGYWYVVKIPEGSGGQVTIRVFDAQFSPNHGLSALAGDSTVSSSANSTNFYTHYRVYRQTNPLDFTSTGREAYSSGGPSNEPNSCHWRLQKESDWEGRWVDLCTVNAVPGAVYFVNVRTTTVGNANSDGRNGYAIEACLSTSCVSPGQPALYALNRMVMYNNVNTGSATFYIAEVGPQYAGKSLVLELFDPGEASGQAWMYPMKPSKTAPKPVVRVPASDCDFSSTRNGYPRGVDRNDGTRCGIRTADGSSLFNGHWVTIRIDIPADYDCEVGIDPETQPNSCWWGIEYRFNGSATDTTTWKARIEGNPVHLTE